MPEECKVEYLMGLRLLVSKSKAMRKLFQVNNFTSANLIHNLDIIFLLVLVKFYLFNKSLFGGFVIVFVLLFVKLRL